MPRPARRNFYTTSSCGVCGKASIDAVRVQQIEPPNPDCRVDPEVLCRLPERLRAAQADLRPHRRAARRRVVYLRAASCSCSAKM